MTRVFISYRRDDSADVTGRIFDRLRAHFDKQVLFRDVDVIPFGSDFRQVIRKAVEDCQVLLAVIGPTWLTIATEDSTRRLDDPHDFVRLEIETALKRNIPVIPVLVSKAAMPKAAHLPDSLRDLVYRNGLEVGRDPHFHRDVDTLIRGLTGLLDASPPSSPLPTKAGDSTELILPGGVKMAFAWCPPGTFLMGSEKGSPHEKPVHRVTLTKGFYMGVYPVTQAQWMAVMGANPSHFKGNTRPVDSVSWDDAGAFRIWPRITSRYRVELGPKPRQEVPTSGSYPGPYPYYQAEGIDRKADPSPFRGGMGVRLSGQDDDRLPHR